MSKQKQASLLVQGYEVVIGFETHAQLATNSKIFSRAATAFGLRRLAVGQHFIALRQPPRQFFLQYRFAVW